MGDVTSAVPADLASFVNNGSKLRSPLSSTSTSLASLQKQVLTNSPDYGVAGSTLPSVDSTLNVMAYNEAFVETIRTELLAADHSSSGAISVSNTAIDAALRQAGNLGVAPPVITVGQTQLFGKPPTSGFVDDPICAANGNFVHEDLDLGHPGWAAALDVTRVYNSLAADVVGAYGPGWSSIHELELTPMGDGVVWATLADGAGVAFVGTAGENDYRVVGPRPLRLTADPDGAWTMHEGHVKHWTFTADGVFTGGTAGPATLTVERDGDGHIIGLAETRSGRSVTYTWVDDRIVAAATSDGRTATYTYDDAGALVHVERPAGSIDFTLAGNLIVEVTDADGVRLAHNVYDDTGRVIEQTNELGRTTRYDYSPHGTTLVSDTVDGPRNAFTHDTRGNLTAMVDGHGRALRLTYDDADRVTRVVDRTGAITTHTYDERGNLATRTDPDGLGQAWTWDDQDRLIAETHRNGAVTTYAYDGSQRQPSLITGPDGATITITVDAEIDKPIEMVDADGVRATFAYDGDGQLTSATDALGRATTVRYDATGSAVETVDAAGGVTRLTNDGAGRLIESVIGDDHIRFAYSAAGRPISGVDTVGQAWTATFGEHGHLDTITDGEGSTVTYEWDLFGNIAAVIAPDGQRFGHIYDESNNLVAAFDPAGNTSRRELDAEGRVIAVTDPEGNAWHRELDVLGRTLVSIDPTGARTRYEYDSLGLVSRVVHPDGHVVAAEHDVAGRTTAVIDELGARYEYGYTPAGRLAERRWPSGRVERWTYDAAGRLASHEEDGVRTELSTDGLGRITTVDAPGGQLRVERSSNGDPVSLTDAIGSERFEVDAAGRIVGAIDGTGHRSAYDWDSRGLLRAGTDPAGLVTSLEYDVRGRQSAEITPTGDVFGYGYDATGWLTSFTDPTGTTTNRRDAAGRIVGVDRPGLPSVDISRDVLGRSVAVGAAGRTDRTFAYDERGRLTEAVQVAQNLRTSFGWDAVGRLDSITGPSGSLAAERDADGRLTGWTQDDARTGLRFDDHGQVVGLEDSLLGLIDAPGPLSFGRDLAGRITSDDRGTTYRYDDAGRLAEVLTAGGAQHHYRYGEDGLLASELGPDGETSYRRGLLGRVEAVVHPDWTETRFGYDARGRRVTAREPDGTLTRYRWDSFDRLTGLERTDADGRVERHRFTVDALGRPVSIDGQPVLWDDLRTGHPLQIGDTRYLHLDGRHATADDVDWSALGDDPWGSDAVDTPHVGLRNELAGFGLVWMGARVYDPATREFLSPDPLLATPGRPGASSAYSYGFLDPVNYLDPTGLKPVSQEEWDAKRKSEEQGRLGQAWEAIKSDPWGTLAMVGVAAVGVGLCFVPGGQAIGVGILIGVGTGAVSGLATGNFNPRAVAVSGAFGAIPGGSTLRSAMLVGAAGGVGADATTQLVTTGHIDPSSFGPSALLGAGGGALGHGINTKFGGAHPAVDEPGPPALPPAPERLALPPGPERLALPPGRTPLAIEAGPQPLAIEPPPTRLALPPGGSGSHPDFVAGPSGSQPPVPVSQARMQEGLDRAGFPSRPTSSPGTEYDLPDGTKVRLMEPTNYAPRRASFTNGNGQPIDPFTNKPVQPPPPQGMSMKQYVREHTHVEQQP